MKLKRISTLCNVMRISRDNHSRNACQNNILISAVADCQSKTSSVSPEFK